jgi:hypothetical protein
MDLSLPTNQEITLVKSFMEKYKGRISNMKRSKVPGAIYCGRPSKWGNRFTHFSGVAGTTEVRSRVEAVVFYRRDLIDRIKAGEVDLDELVAFHTNNSNLECYCAPLLCHCGVILAEAEIQHDLRK